MARIIHRYIKNVSRKNKKIYPLLYNEIFRLALDSGWSSSNIEVRDVNQLLNWSSTPQGNSFWSAVQGSNWGLAKELQPKLFRIEEEIGYTLENNGLFK